MKLCTFTFQVTHDKGEKMDKIQGNFTTIMDKIQGK